MAIELTQSPECGSCKWWGDHDNGVAPCRRYPPTLVVLKGEEHTAFPETWHNEFCGEWAEIQKPEKQIDLEKWKTVNLIAFLRDNGASTRLRMVITNSFKTGIGGVWYEGKWRYIQIPEKPSVYDLLKFSKDELLEMRNFAQVSLSELVGILGKHGIKLRDRE